MKLSAIATAAILAGNAGAFFFWKPITIPLRLPILTINTGTGSGGGGGSGGGSGGGGGGGTPTCHCPVPHPPPACPSAVCPTPECPKNPEFDAWEKSIQGFGCTPATAKFDKDGNFFSC